MKHLNSGFIGSVLLLGALATNVEAVVIYDWYDAASNSNVGPISASIAFDESIWEFGGTFVYDTPYRGGPIPFFGVVSIDFATPLNLDSTPSLNQGFTDPIQLKQSTCAQSVHYGFDPIAYCRAQGLGVDDLVVTEGYWKFHLTFGEYLQGSMYLNDTYTNVGMGSMGHLFTISDLRSDSPGPCFLDAAACVGGTGYWKLAQVSEPITGLLLAAGLLPMLVLQRRRSMLKQKVHNV